MCTRQYYVHSRTAKCEKAHNQACAKEKMNDFDQRTKKTIDATDRVNLKYHFFVKIRCIDIFIPLKGTKIDVMQTNALGAPINKPNAPAKMCYLLLTIIRTISKIFMMVPPVAKTGEMANHGGSGGRHCQN